MTVAMSPFWDSAAGSFIGTALAMALTVMLLAFLTARDNRRRKRNASATRHAQPSSSWYSDSDAVNDDPDLP